MKAGHNDFLHETVQIHQINCTLYLLYTHEIAVLLSNSWKASGGKSSGWVKLFHWLLSVVTSHTLLFPFKCYFTRCTVVLKTITLLSWLICFGQEKASVWFRELFCTIFFCRSKDIKRLLVSFMYLQSLLQPKNRWAAPLLSWLVSNQTSTAERNVWLLQIWMLNPYYWIGTRASVCV